MRGRLRLGAALLGLVGCSGAGAVRDPPPASPPGVAAAPTARGPHPRPPAARAAGAASSGPGAPAAAPVSPGEPSPPAAASAVGWLKGQTHVHSSGSYDARTPPDEVLRFYADRGYGFVAITDHNRITVAEAPPGLLVVAGVELTQNSTVCSPPPKPGYRCLFHVSGLFLDPALDPARGARFTPQFQEDRLRAYGAFAAQATRLGGVAVINHPLFHFALDAPALGALVREGVTLVELFNASLDAQHPSGRADAERHAEALWDRVLAAGHRVHALASDDAHHFADAATRRQRGKFAYEGDRGWVQVRARRDPAAIRAAMLAGDFYASTGLRLRRLEVGQGRIVVEVDDAPPGTSIRWVTGPDAPPEREGAPASARPLKPGERYLRAVAEAPDGRRAWTQALMAGAADGERGPPGGD